LADCGNKGKAKAENRPGPKVGSQGKKVRQKFKNGASKKEGSWCVWAQGEKQMKGGGEGKEKLGARARSSEIHLVRKDWKWEKMDLKGNNAVPEGPGKNPKPSGII